MYIFQEVLCCWGKIELGEETDTVCNMYTYALIYVEVLKFIATLCVKDCFKQDDYVNIEK